MQWISNISPLSRSKLKCLICQMPTRFFYSCTSFIIKTHYVHIFLYTCDTCMNIFLIYSLRFCFEGVSSTSVTTVRHQWKKVFTIVKIASTRILSRSNNSASAIGKM
jgi:hypothetical protein